MRAALVLLCLAVAACTPPAAQVATFGHLAAAGYDAAQLQDAYGLAGAHAAGHRGAGARVGIVTWGPASQSALDAYADANGLPRSTLVHHGACHGPQLAEWDLDVQMVKAAAPEAELHVYCADAARFTELRAALRAAVSAGMHVLSLSWGTCEDRVDAATVAAFHAAFADASARGVAVFAASGDGGSRECTRWSPAEQALRTSWPATSPLVVAVGGTRLEAGASWSEAVWNTCAPCPDAAWSASGGGRSIHHDAPWWQGDGARASPDVAAVADRATGVAVRSGDGWLAMGGTSAATPLWAGAWALAVGARGAMGAPGPLLYGLPAEAWRDVTEGHNGDHAAAPGRDLATGWGGLRAAAMLDRVLALPPAPSDVHAARGPGRGEITLSWSAVAGASSYVVLAGDVAGDERPLAETSDTSFVVAGLADGATAWSRVAARAATGDGPASLPAAGRAPSVPDAPRNVSALPSLAGPVVRWSAPADDGGFAISSYLVLRHGAPIATLPADAREHVDGGCALLSLCAYQVRASTALGEGAASEAAVAPGTRLA